MQVSKDRPEEVFPSDGMPEEILQRISMGPHQHSSKPLLTLLLLQPLINVN